LISDRFVAGAGPVQFVVAFVSGARAEEDAMAFASFAWRETPGGATDIWCAIAVRPTSEDVEVFNCGCARSMAIPSPFPTARIPIARRSQATE
jgi:hypothetical protein